VTTLAAMVRAGGGADVERTKAEGVAAAASTLLQSGGEAAPVLRNDPREPQQDEPVAEAEAEPEPEPVAAT
jgi:hypothetical protein